METLRVDTTNDYNNKFHGFTKADSGLKSALEYINNQLAVLGHEFIGEITFDTDGKKMYRLILKSFKSVQGTSIHTSKSLNSIACVLHGFQKCLSIAR